MCHSLILKIEMSWTESLSMIVSKREQRQVNENWTFGSKKSIGTSFGAPFFRKTKQVPSSQLNRHFSRLLIFNLGLSESRTWLHPVAYVNQQAWASIRRRTIDRIDAFPTTFRYTFVSIHIFFFTISTVIHLFLRSARHSRTITEDGALCSLQIFIK